MNTLAQTITLQTLIEIGLAFMGIWGFVKVVNEVIKAITARHDREQKWDDYEKNLQEERDKIYEKYDSRLEEVEKKLEDNHTDTEAKIQEIRAELYLQTECMRAVLEGLQQLNCNGPVSEAKKKLDAHLLERAYDQ